MSEPFKHGDTIAATFVGEIDDDGDLVVETNSTFEYVRAATLVHAADAYLIQPADPYPPGTIVENSLGDLFISMIGDVFRPVRDRGGLPPVNLSRTFTRAELSPLWTVLAAPKASA